MLKASLAAWHQWRKQIELSAWRRGENKLSAPTDIHNDKAVKVTPIVLLKFDDWQNDFILICGHKHQYPLY